MEYKYLQPDGVKLFYAEANAGSATTIFFIHGNSSSHATWRQQLESAALSSFRLIAFDLPAHGRSDPAAGITDNYSLPGIGALMAKAVLQLSEGRPFLLAGSSIGTNIIAEMLAHPPYPAGVLLEGSCILGGAYTPDRIIRPGTCIGLGFVDELTDEDLACLGKLITSSRDEILLDQIANDFRMVKDRFRSRLGNSVAAGVWSDEIALIKERSVPVLGIFAGPDPGIYEDYLDDAGLRLWKGKFIKLAGAGHWAHLDEPERFTSLLRDFAGEITAIDS